jgi:hypothetical protein
MKSKFSISPLLPNKQQGTSIEDLVAYLTALSFKYNPPQFVPKIENWRLSLF